MAAVLGRFVAGTPASAIPAEAIDRAVLGATDYLAVAIPGAGHPMLRPLRFHVLASSAAGRSTVLGSAAALAAQGAATVNAAAGHALDFDDTHDRLCGHPTTVVLPAALAVGEEVDADGPGVLAAYVLGVEVETALAVCLDAVGQSNGSHQTAVLGVFGAAAAASRLLGSTAEQTASALAIAGAMAAGVRSSFGTAMKPAQVGMASGNGVMAAELARAGMAGNPGALDSPEGALWRPGGPTAWQHLSGLGERWHIVDPGLTVKRYPCCASTHPAVEAALAARERYPGRTDELACVEVRLHPRRLGHINRPGPVTESQARFSVQYAVAVALRHGDAGPARFTGEALRDPATRALAARVALAELAPADQVILPGRDDCFAGLVTVTDRQGQSYSGRVDAPRSFRGDPAERRAAVEEKFGELIGPVFGPSGTAGLLCQLRGLAAGEATARSVMGACRAEAVSR